MWVELQEVLQDYWVEADLGVVVCQLSADEELPVLGVDVGAVVPSLPSWGCMEWECQVGMERGEGAVPGDVSADSHDCAHLVWLSHGPSLGYYALSIQIRCRCLSASQLHPRWEICRHVCCQPQCCHSYYPSSSHPHSEWSHCSCCL